jgi:hypothetical protein
MPGAAAPGTSSASISAPVRHDARVHHASDAGRRRAARLLLPVRNWRPEPGTASATVPAACRPPPLCRRAGRAAPVAETAGAGRSSILRCADAPPRRAAAASAPPAFFRPRTAAPAGCGARRMAAPGCLGAKGNGRGGPPQAVCCRCAASGLRRQTFFCGSGPPRLVPPAASEAGARRPRRLSHRGRRRAHAARSGCARSDDRGAALRGPTAACVAGRRDWRAEANGGSAA